MSGTIIAVASSKGGAGKTTICVSLASEFARIGREQGLRVEVVDTDSNGHSHKWGSLGKLPENLKVTYMPDEDKALDEIIDASDRADIVIIDMEGSRNRIMSQAVNIAHLVLLACQASKDDADEAVEVIKMIKAEERVRKRNMQAGWEIHHKIAFTRTSAAIVSKFEKNLREFFKENDINALEVSLMEKEAYRVAKASGVSVYDLTKKDVGGVEGAQKNINAFTKCVSKALKEISGA